MDRKNIPIAKILLADGVGCDCEESDRPHPQHSLDNGYYFGDLSKPEEFMPPLIRAVKQGEIELTRLLLAHGANANVGYRGFSFGASMS